jgi:hypothetical protein
LLTAQGYEHSTTCGTNHLYTSSNNVPTGCSNAQYVSLNGKSLATYSTETACIAGESDDNNNNNNKHTILTKGHIIAIVVGSVIVIGILAGCLSYLIGGSAIVTEVSDTLSLSRKPSDFNFSITAPRETSTIEVTPNPLNYNNNNNNTGDVKDLNPL